MLTRTVILYFDVVLSVFYNVLVRNNKSTTTTTNNDNVATYVQKTGTKDCVLKCQNNAQKLYVKNMSDKKPNKARRKTNKASTVLRNSGL